MRDCTIAKNFEKNQKKLLTIHGESGIICKLSDERVTPGGGKTCTL